MRTSPIYLDKLEKSLRTEGFAVSRSQALRIASAAFGFRNANEFSAATKRGDLDAPRAQYVGTTTVNGETMVVMRDPTADAMYAIEGSFAEQVIDEERGEMYGTSPYGHLLDMAASVTSPPVQLDADPGERFVAIVEHQHGTTTFHARTQEALDRQVADWCTEYWYEIDVPLDEFDPKASPAAEVVERFFHENDRNFLTQG